MCSAEITPKAPSVMTAYADQVKENPFGPIIHAAAVGFAGEGGCHAHHHVAGVRDRRIGQQPFEVLLEQGDEISPNHGRGGDDPREHDRLLQQWDLPASFVARTAVSVRMIARKPTALGTHARAAAIAIGEP